MLFDDHFLELATDTTAIFKDRGSVFHAFAYRVYGEHEVRHYLKDLKAKMADANHHCYAAVLGMDKAWKKWNDDGEPSNTAGMPIYRQIQRLNMTNVLVIVVRYFGGTLLGVPGLINAYGTAAKLALEQAGTIKKPIEEHLKLTFDYRHENEIFQWLRRHDARIVERQDAELGCMIVAVGRSQHEAFRKINEFAGLYNVEITLV